MKKKQKQPQTLKQLQAEWYAKLAQTGFVDIEKTTLPEPALIDFHASRFQQIDPTCMSAQQKYYEDAHDFLHWYKFPTWQQKVAWGLHAKGVSYRKIAKVLKCGVATVHDILHKLKFQQKRPV